jgi:hypothetical protein
MRHQTFLEPRKVLHVLDELTADRALLQALGSPGPAFCRTRIYTLAVVVRLMLLQRLFAEFTLAGAVQLFVRKGHQFGTAPPPEQRISPSASAYCRARKKLPTLVARQVLKQMCERLYGCPKIPYCWGEVSMYVTAARCNCPIRPNW